MNIKSFHQGAGNFRATLSPTEEQIRAATRKGVAEVDSRVTDNEGFWESAERVHAVRTTEEELVQELILQWQNEEHGYIPETKEDDILRLGCENVNSLSLYNLRGSDHGIFDKTAFLDDAMDEMSLGSQRSLRLHELYKETRRNSLRLRTCINEIEQSVSLVRSPVGVPPPNSGSAAPSVPVELGSQTEQRSGVVQGS